MKKTFIFIAAAILCCTAVFAMNDYSMPTYGFCGFTDDGSDGSNISWSYDSYDKMLSITGSGQMDNFLDGPYPWYAYRDEIKSVSIAYGITSIGDFAFTECSAMMSVSIPSSVSYIGNSAFSECSSLISITIPNDLDAIGEYAFLNCSALKKITAPAVALNKFINIYDSNMSFSPVLEEIYVSNGKLDYVGFLSIQKSYKTLRVLDLRNVSNTVIPDLAFANCFRLTSVSFPKNIKKIGLKAFSDCLNLTEIDIPATLEEIDDAAFYNCHSVCRLNFATNGVLNRIGNFAFYGNVMLKTIIVPETVTELGNLAFYGSQPVEISIPDHIQDVFAY